MKIAVIEVAKKHFKLFGTSGNIIAFQWFKWQKEEYIAYWWKQIRITNGVKFGLLLHSMQLFVLVFYQFLTF